MASGKKAEAFFVIFNVAFDTALGLRQVIV
jgi:hypothetical protein